MFRTFERLKLVRGILYRESLDDTDSKLQMVLPAKYIDTVLRSLHDDVGHPGRDRTLSLVKE